MKKIRMEIEDEGIPSTALREISILKSLDHPNIVKYLSFPLFFSISNQYRLKEVEHSNGRLYLLFEYLDIDLRKYMDNKKVNNEAIPLKQIKVRPDPSPLPSSPLPINYY